MCPRRWAFYEMFGPDVRISPWKWEDLINSFESLTSPGQDYKVAFFIDGLDEFEGNHATLVESIKKISTRDGIKICVSSRPWNVFTDAYQRNPSLRLEVLTKKDIELFVKRHFELHPGFLELSDIFPNEASQLIETIVTKASGVFLWVSIVVQSLLTGLTDGDKLSDLQTTLDDLPEDIQELFQRIWDSIDERYKGQALQFVQFHGNAKPPLHAVTLWLADEEDPLNLDIGQLHIRKVVEAMKRRLNSRTKGLLEISTHGHVEYIHRTAFDWINGIWDDIRSRIPEVFDDYLELLKAESCSIMIANKLLDSAKPKDNGLLSTESDGTGDTSHTASRCDDGKNTPASTARLIRILEHLDSNMQTIINLSGKAAARGCSGNTAQHHIIWTSHQCPSPHDTTFVGLAAQFAVVPYLRAKITNKASLRSADTGNMSVLEGAVFGWVCFPTEPFFEPEIQQQLHRCAQTRTDRVPSESWS